jgi:futalosine hydrolase
LDIEPGGQRGMGGIAQEEVSAAELPSLLRGRQLALLAATPLEADPLLLDQAGGGPVLASPDCLLAPGFEVERHLRVAGKSWYLLRLRPADGRVRGWLSCLLVVSGYDKANAAHALTCLLEVHLPDLVLQFGIAGGFGGQGLGLRDLVLATSEVYADTGTSSPEGWLSTEAFGLPLLELDGREFWNEFLLDEALVGRAAFVLSSASWGADAPVVASGPALTVSRVTGLAHEAEELRTRWQALSESMEGAAAAQVCTIYGVPFLEVRAVSNLVGDRDRATWDLRGASARAAFAACVLASKLEEVLGPS